MSSKIAMSESTAGSVSIQVTSCGDRTGALALQDTTSPGIITKTTISVPPEVDIEFTNKSMVRFRHRLQERWTCQTLGHMHCFVNTKGAHIQLSEEAIDIWALALHNGQATLFTPPQSILPSKVFHGHSDAASIQSTSSRATIQYQRRFRWQKHPNITDLRSIQTRLLNSQSSSSTSALSLSSGSSGIPGIGYLSGKAVKWVGIQMLSAFVPLEILRRRWVIHRLTQQLGKVPIDRRTAWIGENEHKITRVIEDLLELSLNQYKEHYRRTAIEEGLLIDDLAAKAVSWPPSRAGEILYSMLVKLTPLRLLADDHPASEDVIDRLRETILQDSSEHDDEEHLMLEGAALLCFELAYGYPSPWREEGYRAIGLLYLNAHGKKSLQTLGQSGILIQDMAAAAFESPIRLGILEQALAVRFFALYANDVPVFRQHLFAPTGIAILGQNIKSLKTEITNTGRINTLICRLLYVISILSDFDWVITTLARLDLSPALVQLLICFYHDTGIGVKSARTCFDILHTLGNLAAAGHSERQAVYDATTDELRQILPHIDGKIRRAFGDRPAGRARKYVQEIWHPRR